MAEEEKRPRVRAFVGLDLPDALKEDIARWSAAELGGPALRVPPRGQLHITLAFLSFLEADELRRAAEVVWRFGAGEIPLRLLPDPVARGRGRPRLFALEVDSDAARGVQARLASELEGAGVYRPEDRPFWPHVTVARVRNEPGGGRPQRLGIRPGRLPDELLGPSFAVRITLYRSQTKSAGAEYTPLAQVELPGA